MLSGEGNQHAETMAAAPRNHPAVDLDHQGTSDPPSDLETQRQRQIQQDEALARGLAAELDPEHASPQAHRVRPQRSMSIGSEDSDSQDATRGIHQLAPLRQNRRPIAALRSASPRAAAVKDATGSRAARTARHRYSVTQQAGQDPPPAFEAVHGPAAQQTTGPDCVICTDTTAADRAIATPCGHHMCDTCLEQLFRHALSDRTQFPPRCCPTQLQGEITLASVRHLLPADLARTFEQKAVEYTTPNGTYCHDPRCATFIPTANVRAAEKVGTCPQCRRQTCTLCKSKMHGGQYCPQDSQQRQFERFAAREGWKPCPQCGIMVDKVIGCNHVK